MRTWILVAAFLLGCLPFGGEVRAQEADDVCREFGRTPSREIVTGQSGRPQKGVFIYGKISLKGVPRDARRPQITAIYSDSQQAGWRQTLTESGNYCFQRSGTGGIIVIEVDGLEIGRKSLSDITNEPLQREDFEVTPPPSEGNAPPGVISARYIRTINPKTTDLYKKAAAAETDKKIPKAIDFVKEIVGLDPEDFVAWAKLGSLYLGQNSFADAEAAFRKALAVRPDYVPALINIGLMRAMEKKFPDAIEIFNQAVAADPTSARGFRLLGEAYLQNRQGSLGLAALDKALEIDPVGMAECHLLKARLYDLAGAKNLASHEYRVFLKKVPDYEDKKTLEKYIKDNPE